MNDTFSVIIPAHNEEKYIEKTIESFKKNSIPFELIVVCDTCSDGTNEILRDPFIKVFNVNYRNVSQTRNFGANKASGSVLVFNDADTIVSSNYLEEILKLIEKNDYGCAKWISESKSLLGRYIAWGTNIYNKDHIGGNFFIRKELFLSVKGFNEQMVKGEDTDLGDRLRNIKAKQSFLKNCFIMPSERKYKERGYVNLIIKSGVEGLIYKLFRNYYNKKIAKV